MLPWWLLGIDRTSKLHQKALHHFAVDVGEAEVAALVFVSEALVVDA